VVQGATRGVMRIVAHNGARIFGGAERATILLLRGLADRGHSVQLLCNDESVKNGAIERGVPADLSPIGGDIAIPHAVRLARTLRLLEPDAFLIGTFKKLFLASLGARMARVPRVVARVGLESDTPRNAKYRVALRRWVDGVAVNAERMVDPFRTLEGFGAGRVALIHNGVRSAPPSKTRDQVRKELGISPDVFVAGTVARLVSQKRIDRLLESLAVANESIHCIIAGDGAKRQELRRQAADLGLTRRVTFLGDRHDVPAVLRAMDVYVVTSDREGLSNAMLEAMTVGLPVISTPVSGAADAIEGDHPAGIIAKFDAHSIARALDEVWINRSRLKEMGAAAQRRAETTFSFDRMVERWEAFLAGSAA
jgi:glycosyltransferase involved in cell wall biosynthesis